MYKEIELKCGCYVPEEEETQNKYIGYDRYICEEHWKAMYDNLKDVVFDLFSAEDEVELSYKEGSGFILYAGEWEYSDEEIYEKIISILHRNGTQNLNNTMIRNLYYVLDDAILYYDIDCYSLLNKLKIA